MQTSWAHVEIHLYQNLYLTHNRLHGSTITIFCAFASREKLSGYNHHKWFLNEWLWLSIFIYSLEKPERPFDLFLSLTISSLSLSPSLVLILPLCSQHFIASSIQYYTKLNGRDSVYFARISIWESRFWMISNRGKYGYEWIALIRSPSLSDFFLFLFQFHLFSANRCVIRIQWYQCIGFTTKFYWNF